MGWLAFYQNWMGVISRSHCRMDPSCSNFSIAAIHKHGSAIGIMMTADRLLHEADEQKQNRFVISSGLASCPDPVSNNDFWWSSRHE
ncbi:MAG: membrane protein insertion efficiency factor YidD [Kiritimatiellia bacterium]